MNLIGLDIGTTSIGGVLYSRSEGKTIGTLTRDNSFIEGAQGEYLQDPNAILQKVKSILDGLIDISPDRIEGISLSAQMHGILYVDREGRAVSPYYTWQNQRGRLVSGDRPLEAVLTEMLGYPVYTGYGIVTHYSLGKDGNIPPSAACFCNIGDFVCMQLAGGKVPVTDITLGASMGIADIRTGQHSGNLSVLGSEVNSRIPEIVSSTRRLGEYRKIPVIQPLGDNQASFLGSVKDRESSLLLNYGTAGQISFFSSSYETFSDFEARPLGNEGFIHAAFSLCGGNSYKILARFFEETAAYFHTGILPSGMNIMNRMVIDFSVREIDCMPFFLGQRGGEEINAYFNNLTERNFTPSNMVRALVQGMVEELYRYYEKLPGEVKDRIRTLIGAGNGIRKNRHLIQAAELRYGMPLSLLDLNEESCLGAVINAGKGTGVYAVYGEGAAEIVRYSQP